MPQDATYGLPQQRGAMPDPSVPLDVPTFETVPQLVARRAREASNRFAIRHRDHAYGYGDLWMAASGMAAHLGKTGLAMGEVVAVTGETGFAMVATMLGVLSAGGVLLLVDPRLPQERQHVMVREARAKYVVFCGAGPNALESESLASVHADAVLDGGASGSDPMTVAPDAPAYIFFTSGTTGVPKGVLGCHRGLSHFLAWQREAFGIDSAVRVAQLTGLSFDVVLRSVFLPLTSGGTLCLPDSSDDLGGDVVLPWLERERVTLLHAVPSLAQQWINTAPSALQLPLVRLTFFAGEPLTDVLVRRWRTLCPSTEVVNLYGPTETTLAKCFFRVPADPLPGVQAIGEPLPETQILVLGERGGLCGVGEVGEIHVRTPFRTLGYLNAPGDMKAKFFPNPFRDDKSDLIYRTGDQGRYRLDGLVEILGRVDDQVKIRGVRVEPSEVAAMLSTHPAVKACTVIALPRPNGDEKNLVAYVVVGIPTASAELRTWLADRLPGAMVPTAFVTLDALPLTANGKVDRKALPLPPESPVASPFEHVAPRTPVEQALTKIWSDLLGVARVGVNDNFFELGGHSLLAIQLVSRASRAVADLATTARGRKKPEVQLSPQDVFQHPTVSDLARVVQKRLDEFGSNATSGNEGATGGWKDTYATVVTSSGERTPGPAPVAYPEERLYRVCRAYLRASRDYNVPGKYLVHGVLDISALESAFNAFLRRHDVLWSAYEESAGTVSKRIEPARPVSLDMTDVSHLAPADRMPAAVEILEGKVRSNDDLSPPQLRLFLCRLADDLHALFVVAPHAVFDMASGQIMFTELGDLYERARRGSLEPLSRPQVQYEDFAQWQRGWLTGRVAKEGIRHWRGYLQGAKPTTRLIPTDFPRQAVDEARTRDHLTLFPVNRASWAVAPQAGRSLRAITTANQVPPTSSLLTALGATLARWTGTPDVLVSVAADARQRVAGIEQTIGCFTNSFLFRIDLAGVPTPPQGVARVGRDLLRVLGLPDFQLVPLVFPKLDDHFRILCNFLRDPVVPSWPNLRFEPIRQTSLRSDDLTFLDMIVTGYEAPDGALAGIVQANGQLWKQETVDRFATELAQELDRIATEPATLEASSGG
jgi:amino acid adenylation domain-containing protein